jgi:hypothetical protein
VKIRENSWLFPEELNMSEEIDDLKQIEKEKLADWKAEFATESDVAQIKAEEESTQNKDQGKGWLIWLAFLFILFVLLPSFGAFNGGFGWWWFFIFLGPWMWGKGGCGRSC